MRPFSTFQFTLLFYLSSMYLPLLLDIPILFGSVCRINWYHNLSVDPNPPIYQPAFCLYYTNLESESHIIFSFISEDNYHRELCLFLNLIFWPQNCIYFLWDKISMCAFLVFSHWSQWLSQEARKTLEMQNFPRELDGIIQHFHWHSFKSLK